MAKSMETTSIIRESRGHADDVYHESRARLAGEFTWIDTDTEAHVIRHYTLNRTDLGFIRQHRWDYNRLDVAVQRCCLRHSGLALARGETPPAAPLGMIATQIQATAVPSVVHEQLQQRPAFSRQFSEDVARS
jgi:Domain of unknown function (DUF4158)